VPDVLERIVEARRRDFERLGPAFGSNVPVRRRRPIVPFIAEPGAILEIKRASPSKGDIAPNLNPADLAAQYAAAGAKNVSVLTERNFFKGSLDDLVAASDACPELSFLRKDFLLFDDDIEIAYRCGADAVLLIARILDEATLLRLASSARSFGMTPFIEVRDEADVSKFSAASKAGLVFAGVNARDLATFRVDPLVPAALRSALPGASSTPSSRASGRPIPQCRVVFESGASTPGACRFARKLGFDGILIGEAAARDPSGAARLVSAFAESKPDWSGQFWRAIGKKTAARVNQKKPLVKICGLTDVGDALFAAELGADFLGFVFASSPRAASSACVRAVADALRARSGDVSLADRRPLLVGVITDPESPAGKEALALALAGTLDAIQYHGVGERGIEPLDALSGPSGVGRYGALRLGTRDDLDSLANIVKDGEPRVLIDARVEGLAGGTGKAIPAELVRAASGLAPLWLSGGLGPRNIRVALEAYEPELVDASSGLESSPGMKDRAALEAFFKEINA